MNFARTRTLNAATLLTLLITSTTPSIASTPASQAEAPFKIGFVTSLTGPGAPGGTDMVRAAKLYLEQHQNKFGNRKVELLVEDDESQPTVAAVKMRKLVDTDHVQVLDGLVLSNIAYKVAAVADELKVPLIIANPYADDLTKRKMHEWAVRTSQAASQPMHPFGEWVAKHLPYKRVAVIGTDYAMSWEAVGGFQTTFEQNGGKIIQKQWVPLFAKEFTSYIKKISPDADAIFFAVADGPAPTVINEYKASGGKLPIIGNGASFDDRVLDKAGEQSLGAISALNYSSALQTPANKSFVAAYLQKYPGVYPSRTAEGAFVSMLWLDEAVQALKEKADDRKSLIDAIKAAKITAAPRGPLKLDAYGNPIQNIYVLKVTKANGHYQNTVIDTYKDVSQFWKSTPADFMKRPAYTVDYPVCKNCVKP